ncbi:Na/Pi cotransporter family protein [Marinobacterium rhizophilum]|uniref:Na/Pi cotransporter family protein n=1 Tax=Marinobacterium rhizophilum TaxID=420402 RepID=A0ABY5HI89_9GAMM|nr:Na/Pi cotransporter family protein [Marinobacterium rhizophilum]UTW11963.1 Na/Pi cotransporter family protein [Marinobacterium rhizophilum]
MFLLQLFGATMLLLYSVRMVRTGIERSFGASFKRIITTAGVSFRAAFTGLTLAIVLQSSAAVAILVSDFAGKKVLQFGAGLAIVLGADLGSALLIQILSFDLEWLVPVLLTVGGTLFLKTDSRKLKQAGRVILGLAFILISLKFLRETMDPIRDSAFLPAIAGYLEKDFLTAFLVGAALAFVMHSSVAVILMCVTLVSIDAIPLGAGISLVLGANLGSATVPIWLNRGAVAKAKRILLVNLAIRGSGAFIVLLILNGIVVTTYMTEISEAQSLVLVHILFNFALLVFLPFLKYLQAPAERFIPDDSAPVSVPASHHVSVLNDGLLNNPRLALIGLRREVLRMLHLVELMTTPILDIYEKYSDEQAREIVKQDRYVNDALKGIRTFVSALPTDTISHEENNRLRNLIEYAIALEQSGDIVVLYLAPRAEQMYKEGGVFSSEGKRELLAMHELLLENLNLAASVLISDDLSSARLLKEGKTEMTNFERSSRTKHLNRLQAGTRKSISSSDIHLDTLRSIRHLNSLISSVCYPILIDNGLLLKSRLLSEEETAEEYTLQGSLE